MEQNSGLYAERKAFCTSLGYNFIPTDQTTQHLNDLFNSEVHFISLDYQSQKTKKTKKHSATESKLPFSHSIMLHTLKNLQKIHMHRIMLIKIHAFFCVLMAHPGKLTFIFLQGCNKQSISSSISYLLYISFTLSLADSSLSYFVLLYRKQNQRQLTDGCNLACKENPAVKIVLIKCNFKAFKALNRGT